MKYCIYVFFLLSSVLANAANSNKDWNIEIGVAENFTNRVQKNVSKYSDLVNFGGEKFFLEWRHSISDTYEWGLKADYYSHDVAIDSHPGTYPGNSSIDTQQLFSFLCSLRWYPIKHKRLSPFLSGAAGYSYIIKRDKRENRPVINSRIGIDLFKRACLGFEYNWTIASEHSSYFAFSISIII